MEADFAELMAALKLEQIRLASSTAVLARPTGTSLSDPRSEKKRKTSDERPGRRPRK